MKAAPRRGGRGRRGRPCSSGTGVAGAVALAEPAGGHKPAHELQAARSLRVEAQELHGEAERRRVAINRALAGARSVARHAHQSSPLRPCGRPHSPVGARPRNAAAALRPPAKAAADRPAAGALTDVAATTRPRRRWRAPAGWQAAGSHGRTTLRAAPRESPDAWAPAWRLPDA